MGRGFSTPARLPTAQGAHSLVYRYFGLSLLMVVVCLCEGCSAIDSTPIKADHSTPKAAAMSYLKAVATGDVRTATALSLGTPAQKEWVVGRVALVDGMRNFDDALYAKFGRVTTQVHTDLHDSLQKLSDFWITCIDDGSVSSDDDNARIDPARHGFFTRNVNAVYLHREKDGWKVVLSATYPGGGTPDQDAQITSDYQQWRQFGEIFKGVAREIKAGKFHSEDEANRALLNRLSAMRKS